MLGFNRNLTIMIFSRRSRHMIEVVRAMQHLPDEIFEEILLRLPVKSLLRFSAVSKSWYSIIHHPRFMKKYVGHERIISLHYSYSLSSLLSDDPIVRATKLVPPSDVVDPSLFQVRAFCNGLWCVQNTTDNSLLLWNPSIRTYRKLPNPLLDHALWKSETLDYYYGLGYDFVRDDYKLLNIRYGIKREVMLYSLRSNSWRKIQSFPEMNMSSWSWFVSGALHWLCYHQMSDHYGIVSFDLWEEEYGEVGMPPEYDRRNELDKVELVVLRGKLCLSVSYWDEPRFVLWMMEEYGVVGSWSRKFDIDYSNICGFENVKGLRALYMSRYGEIVICVTRNIYGEERRYKVMLMNKSGKTLMRKDFGRHTKFYGGGLLLYNETLVSPAL